MSQDPGTLEQIVNFLTSYPLWVKVLVVVWFLLTSIILASLILSRPQQKADREVTPQAFKLKLSIREDSPGDNPFRVVLFGPDGQELADLFVAKGTTTEITLSRDLEGKGIRIWYDFYPRSLLAKPLPLTEEHVTISTETLLVPTDDFVTRFHALDD